MQYLISVIDDKSGSATPAEMAAIRIGATDREEF